MLIWSKPNAQGNMIVSSRSYFVGGDMVTTESDGDGDGFTVAAGDCDDTNDTVFPGATEVCDDLDNDCDSRTDELLRTEFWPDGDDDTYGDPDAASTWACTAPAGLVAGVRRASPGTSIVVLAGPPRGPELADVVQIGADGIVARPLHRARLIEAVEAFRIAGTPSNEAIKVVVVPDAVFDES